MLIHVTEEELVLLQDSLRYNRESVKRVEIPSHLPCGDDDAFADRVEADLAFIDRTLEKLMESSPRSSVAVQLPGQSIQRLGYCVDAPTGPYVQLLPLLDEPRN